MTGVEQPRDTIVTGTSRLSQWFAMAFFASIALIALTTRYNDFESETAVVKWALSVLCIAIGMSGLAIIASYTVPDKFSGTKVEGGMVSAYGRRIDCGICVSLSLCVFVCVCLLTPFLFFPP